MTSSSATVPYSGSSTASGLSIRCRSRCRLQRRSRSCAGFHYSDLPRRRGRYPRDRRKPEVLSHPLGLAFGNRDVIEQVLRDHRLRGSGRKEPLNEDGFGDFLDEFSAHGLGFEARLLDLLGRENLRPLALSSFPGFRHGTGAREANDGERDIEPLPGSTAAIRAQNAGADRAMVVHTANPAGCQNMSSRPERAGSTRLLAPVDEIVCSTHGRKQSLPVWRRANRMSDNPRRPLLRAAKTDTAPTKNCEACAPLPCRRLRDPPLLSSVHFLQFLLG